MLVADGDEHQSFLTIEGLSVSTRCVTWNGSTNFLLSVGYRVAGSTV